MILQLDLLQEGGLPGDVKVMSSGLHAGLHHSLAIESSNANQQKGKVWKPNAQLFTAYEYDTYEPLFRFLRRIKILMQC
jgi:hypothetical protein